jgi:transcription antitermination factor NusG
VITYPHKEREYIFDTIKREGFDIKPYCPMVRASATSRGLVRIGKKPLLFNYMFWRYDLEEYPHELLVAYLPFRMVRFGGKPRFITSKELSRVKRMVKSQESKFDKMRDDVDFLRKFIGSNVLVRDGVFTGLMGKVIDARRQGQLIIELLVFNRPIGCEVSVEYVEFVRS